MAGSIQEVNKAIANMNKGSDKKEEMRMKLAAYSNWDRFLTPAPVSIALLGQLILVSADTDFSLEAKAKEVNFKLLKYPDSFRACLVQVSKRIQRIFTAIKIIVRTESREGTLPYAS